MHTTALPRTHAAARQWMLRGCAAIAAAAAAVWHAWRERQRFDREHRERALLAELDPRVLRDIGAPDWMEGEAHARRAARQDEREQLRLDGGAINTRFW